MIRATKYCMHYAVLHSTTKYYKYYSVLHSTINYYTVLQSTTPYYTVLQNTIPRGLTFRYGRGLWRVWTPGAALREPSSPDERPPPSLPVRQGDSAYLPSLFHLAPSNTPNSLRPSRGCVFGTSCDLDYRPLAYPIAWHNWGYLMQSDPHSAPLFRFTLLTIYQLICAAGFFFDILDQVYEKKHK